MGRDVCSKLSLAVPPPLTRLQVARAYSTTTPFHTKANEGMVLFDSLSESFKSIASSDEKGIAWYTCGPTTYASAHLGHARTYVCLDIVRRILEHTESHSGKPAPLFVMNVTDVDDKILAAAKETGETPVALARRYEHEFWQDLDDLGCLRPHVVTRVTEHVESDLIPYIERLVKSGLAYSSDDGVYFDVRAFEAKMGHITKYGKLAPSAAATDFFVLNDDTTSAVSKKKDQRDFVLWKNRKDGEDLWWDSPWGKGRPGWHIECSAMIESVQNKFDDSHKFTVHAGGVDLMFPHHTNEIAQSEAYHSSELPNEWIPHWVHTGHLHIHGLKMSKSLKNFITIRQLLEVESSLKSALSAPGDDFRLWCLGISGCYRGSATYSKERIDEAKMIREKIVKFLMDGEAWMLQSKENAPKKWTGDDHCLWMQGQTTLLKSYEALIGSTQIGQKNFDLDGKAFIDALVKLVEVGNAHIARVKPGDGVIEPISFILQSLRNRLSLVGFTSTTTLAGLDIPKNISNESSIVGGERTLVKEFVRFRTDVRRAVLLDMKTGDATENIKSILKLCDDLRNDSLPSIGVELIDAKLENEQSQAWRFCLPRQRERNDQEGRDDKGMDTQPDLCQPTVSLHDLFRVGQYEGLFSTFDDKGIPLTTSDGSQLSISLMKKLKRKREKYMKKNTTKEEKV